MATHSSILAWRVLGMEEPAGLPSMGSHRVGHDWSDLAAASNGTPLQYSCLENTMDGRAWWAAVHGVPKSQTRLSNFTFTSHFHALEKEMATHSSVFAWRIPGTVETGGLPSMWLHRVGHDWSDLAATLFLIIKYFLQYDSNITLPIGLPSPDPFTVASSSFLIFLLVY